jgi:hypothetical protein
MNKLREYLNRNSYLLGIALAIIVPLLSTIIIFPMVNLMKSIGWVDVHFPISKYLLLCCIPNFIYFRMYIKKPELEKTGKAILIVSIIELIGLLILSNRAIF